MRALLAAVLFLQPEPAPPVFGGALAHADILQRVASQSRIVAP